MLPEVSTLGGFGQTLCEVRDVLVVHQVSFLFQVHRNVSQWYLELI